MIELRKDYISVTRTKTDTADIERLAGLVCHLGQATDPLMPQIFRLLTDAVGSDHFLPLYAKLFLLVHSFKWKRDDIFNEGYVVPFSNDDFGIDCLTQANLKSIDSLDSHMSNNLNNAIACEKLPPNSMLHDVTWIGEPCSETVEEANLSSLPALPASMNSYVSRFPLPKKVMTAKSHSCLKINTDPFITSASLEKNDEPLTTYKQSAPMNVSAARQSPPRINHQKLVELRNRLFFWDYRSKIRSAIFEPLTGNYYRCRGDSQPHSGRSVSVRLANEPYHKSPIKQASTALQSTGALTGCSNGITQSTAPGNDLDQSRSAHNNKSKYDLPAQPYKPYSTKRKPSQIPRKRSRGSAKPLSPPSTCASVPTKFPSGSSDMDEMSLILNSPSMMQRRPGSQSQVSMIGYPLTSQMLKSPIQPQVNMYSPVTSMRGCNMLGSPPQYSEKPHNVVNSPCQSFQGTNSPQQMGTPYQMAMNTNASSSQLQKNFQRNITQGMRTNGHQTISQDFSKVSPLSIAAQIQSSPITPVWGHNTATGTSSFGFNQAFTHALPSNHPVINPPLTFSPNQRITHAAQCFGPNQSFSNDPQPLDINQALADALKSLNADQSSSLALNTNQSVANTFCSSFEKAINHQSFGHYQAFTPSPHSVGPNNTMMYAPQSFAPTQGMRMNNSHQSFGPNLGMTNSFQSFGPNQAFDNVPMSFGPTQPFAHASPSIKIKMESPVPSKTPRKRKNNASGAASKRQHVGGMIGLAMSEIPDANVDHHMAAAADHQL